MGGWVGEGHREGWCQTGVLHPNQPNKDRQKIQFISGCQAHRC
jgi:hypothetical protein